MQWVLGGVRFAEKLACRTLLAENQGSIGFGISWTAFMDAPVYHAVIRRDGKWWIGWVEEVPGVNSQGETREELISNLREALGEALEMNREDARKAAGDNYEEVALVL